jgi:hypothetical protein
MTSRSFAVVASMLLVVSTVVGVGMVAAGPWTVAAQEPTNGTDVRSGAIAASAVGAQNARVDSAFQSGRFSAAFDAADSDRARAAVIGTALSNAEDRLDRLQSRADTLESERESGALTQSEFQARMATVRAGAASVARLGANISAAAESVPASALRAEGVDPAAVERLTSESRELATSGPTTLGVDRFDRTFYTQLSTIVASHNEGDHDLGRAGTLLTGNVVNLHVTGPDGDETVVSFRITDEGRIEDVGAGAHSRAKIKMSTDRETMRSISDANNPGAAFRNAVQLGAIRIDGIGGIGSDLTWRVVNGVRGLVT